MRKEIRTDPGIILIAPLLSTPSFSILQKMYHKFKIQAWPSKNLRFTWEGHARGVGLPPFLGWQGEGFPETYPGPLMLFSFP